MSSKIFVAVFNGNENTLKHPILGRPFSHNLDKIMYTPDFSDADYILGNLDYLECNRDYHIISQTEIFRKYQDKFVFWSMHDNPTFAYLDTKTIKFLCQPIMDPKTNKRYNVIPVPLQMRHYELEMTKDKNFINKIRNTKKENNFVYVGQIIYANRQWLRNLKLPKYDFEETKPIWDIKNTESRVELNKQFCQRISKSKYCFAPRGVGSSSFRLYQSMMAGTVPIESGMKDYPFKEFVDWNSFTIKNEKKMINLLTNEEKYVILRKNAINFWDKYVDIPSCDRIIFESYLK
jgi:hypothetical protein